MRHQIYGYIVDDIIEKIKNRVLTPNEKLLTESNLCEHYSASRSTVKKALKELIYLGYIYSIERVGNYVSPPNTSDYYFNYDKLFDSEYSVTLRTVFDPVISKAPFSLEKKGESAILFVRKALSSKTLISYEKKYVFVRRGLLSHNGIKSEDFLENMFILLDKYRVNSTLEILSVFADETLAEELNVKPGVPFFLVKEFDYDYYGKLICYSETYSKFDLFKLHGSSDIKK